MPILGGLADFVVGLAGGPATALSIFTIEHGDEVFDVTADIARQIVNVGEDVYRTAPPELFAVTGDPLHGLLKHEAEDEVILLGYVAGEVAISSALTWAAAGPIGASASIAQGLVPAYVAIGSLIGKIHFRRMNSREWKMAQYVFGDTLYDRDEILLTNLGGKDGRAFVFPVGLHGPVLVNMGSNYVHNATTARGDILMHELAHVWQARRRKLTEIFLFDALSREYDFSPGKQWHQYNLEQQAGIVEAWVTGATAKVNGELVRTTNAFAVGSPLFRYINGNIRRASNSKRTRRGRSARRLLAEGGHRSVRQMHPPPPRRWWT